MSSTPTAPVRPPTGVRVTVYTGHGALHRICDLTAVRAAGRRGDGPDEEAPWLRTCLDEDEALVVTVSLDARLAGFVCAAVTDGQVRISEIALDDAAAARHPAVLTILLEAVLDAADRPWLQLLLPHDEEALRALQAAGWRTESTQAEYLVLTAA